MTEQEYRIIKTVILACTDMVISNGCRVPYANTDRVLASLDCIYAEELGVEPSERLTEPLIHTAESSTQEDTLKKGTTGIWSRIFKEKNK